MILSILIAYFIAFTMASYFIRKNMITAYIGSQTNNGVL